MATRATGFALLASNSVQEASDFAAIAHAATLEARVPFLHFFDGFRTSHEVNMITPIGDDDLRALVDEKFVRQHRERALSPDRPIMRGTAQNPDVFFQAREACNPFYLACPTIVQDVMDRFARQTGRQYRLFDYYGPADAERLIILMGSGAGAAEEAVDALQSQGEVRLLKVLFPTLRRRIVPGSDPKSVRSIAAAPKSLEVWASRVPRRAHGLYGEHTVDSSRRPKDYRRTVWLVVEGIHPGDGQDGFRRIADRRAEKPLHGRHSGRCHAHQPSVRS
jgi:pyruvate-ferredoxin/flavodoxin oxidoreductase